MGVQLHDDTRVALERDGWTITDDPFRPTLNQRDAYPDAERPYLVAADRADESIVVAPYDFDGRSEFDDLFSAVGRFLLCDLVRRSLVGGCISRSRAWVTARRSRMTSTS